MVKSSGREVVVVGSVDQPLGNGDGRAKFLFHKVCYFCKMDFVNLYECGEFVRNVIQLFVHSFKMLLVKVGDVHQVVNPFVFVDNLCLQY